MEENRIFDWKKEKKLVVFKREETTDELNRVLMIPCSSQSVKITYGKIEGEEFQTNIDFSIYEDGDILEITEAGMLRRVFTADRREADIFVTNKCNSNCIMCPVPESVRRKKENGYMEWLFQYIQILPQYISYINITGGEPTLEKENFIKVLDLLKKKYQHAGFQLLTNGRSLADIQFSEKIISCSPAGMRFAIPLHASEPEAHDKITCVQGSFLQTDSGIKNLLVFGQKVEIRVVISKKNIDYIEATAEYIARNYKGALCVNFIAMEMMGNAAANRDEVWVDYPVAFRRAKPAIELLIKNGFDVQLYNFPLCAVDKGYWHIAAKSITDYKVRYMDECEGCKVKEICGGFFASTKQIIHPEVTPIG